MEDNWGGLDVSNQLLSINYMRTMTVFTRGPMGTKEEIVTGTRGVTTRSDFRSVAGISCRHMMTTRN